MTKIAKTVKKVAKKATPKVAKSLKVAKKATVRKSTRKA